MCMLSVTTGSPSSGWDPVRLQRSGGLRRSEIGRIARIIGENQTLFVEAWHEYFDG